MQSCVRQQMIRISTGTIRHRLLVHPSLQRSQHIRYASLPAAIRTIPLYSRTAIMCNNGSGLYDNGSCCTTRNMGMLTMTATRVNHTNTTSLSSPSNIGIRTYTSGNQDNNNGSGNNEQSSSQPDPPARKSMTWQQMMAYFGVPFSVATALFATTQQSRTAAAANNDSSSASYTPPTLLETKEQTREYDEQKRAADAAMIRTPPVAWYRRLGRRLHMLWRMFILFWIWLPVAVTRPFIDDDTEWATYIVAAMQRSGPAFIKLGQWAATRPDLFPPQVCETLAQLQSDTHPHSDEYSYAALANAFGDEQARRIRFTKLLGSGSLAQVHKATITNVDGTTREVAIKVCTCMHTHAFHPHRYCPVCNIDPAPEGWSACSRRPRDHAVGQRTN